MITQVKYIKATQMKHTKNKTKKKSTNNNKETKHKQPQKNSIALKVMFIMNKKTIKNIDLI